MEFDCGKHNLLFSSYCPRKECNIPLCEECARNHCNHNILTTTHFSDYAIAEIEKHENLLADTTTISRDFIKTTFSLHIRDTMSSAKKLMLSIRETVDSLLGDFREKLLNSIKEAHSLIKHEIASATEIKEMQEKLKEFKESLMTAKANDHFLAVYQTWEEFKKIQFPPKDDNQEKLQKQLDKLNDKIHEIASSLEKNCSNLQEELINSNKIYNLIQENQQTEKLKSNKCWDCGIENKIYLRHFCGHGLCFECAQKEIELKIASKGVKVIDNEMECMICGYEGIPSKLVHIGCKCTIDIKLHKDKFLDSYTWDRENKSKN